MIAFADNFLAGSLLTLLMPTLLLTALAIWYVIAVRRVPEDPPEASSTPPLPEVASAGGDDVNEVTPLDPSDGQV
jgi:hypothetical protein